MRQLAETWGLRKLAPPNRTGVVHFPERRFLQNPASDASGLTIQDQFGRRGVKRASSACSARSRYSRGCAPNSARSPEVRRTGDRNDAPVNAICRSVHHERSELETGAAGPGKNHRLCASRAELRAIVRHSGRVCRARSRIHFDENGPWRTPG